MTPSELLGPLYAAVQSAQIFGDSKDFADAIPLGAPCEIVDAWSRLGASDSASLREFVEANFILPDKVESQVESPSSFEDYLHKSWAALTRDQVNTVIHDSALYLPKPFVVPGGRFRELYYWDSYFTMLGLVESGRQDLVEDMIVNLGSLLDRFGRIPNASRTYYLSRSHPPVFYLAAALSLDTSVEGRNRRLGWMLQEHRFWMDGADTLRLGAEYRRVVHLGDAHILNRYWDDCAEPRDESWREDVSLAESLPKDQRHALWRNLRAAAESGWDFSSRWLSEEGGLESIQTTRIVPVELNCLLYGLEIAIADASADLGQIDLQREFMDRAEERRQAMNAHLWSDAAGCFVDFDIDRCSQSAAVSAASAFPLFVGLCDEKQAASTVKALRELLMPGGLVTTTSQTGEQWDAPNGWAPLQWIAFAGLMAYGEGELAKEIAQRWLLMVNRVYSETGLIFEKYDVVSGGAGSGGEYAVEVGFGWTNGVTLALMRHLQQSAQVAQNFTSEAPIA